jgi:hypothetical protein
VCDEATIRFRRSVGVRKLRRGLSPADTFTGKLLHRMAYDRRRFLTTFADKYAVRSYVAAKIGPGYLNDLHAVIERRDAIPWALLPREFVAKATHGSGGVVIVDESGPRVPLPEDPLSVTWERFIVHPSSLVRRDLEQLCRRWMDLDYSWVPGRSPEWAYKDIRPRVIFERHLRGPDGKVPVDFKLFVFLGKCAVIQVDYDRFGEHRRDFFSPSWERRPFTYAGHPNAVEPMGRPASLAEMIDVAERLGADTDFVRVDLYDVDGKILFGELTNSPECAQGRFDPDAFDSWLGSHWALPDHTSQRWPVGRGSGRPSRTSPSRR